MSYIVLKTTALVDEVETKKTKDGKGTYTSVDLFFTDNKGKKIVDSDKLYPEKCFLDKDIENLPKKGSIISVILKITPSVYNDSPRLTKNINHWEPLKPTANSKKTEDDIAVKEPAAVETSTDESDNIPF